jgi:hypothetical protein
MTDRPWAAASAAILGPSSAVPVRDGATYDHARDGERLHCQHDRVFALMKDGAWRSLAAIASHTGDPPASVSARLRDFRKPRFTNLYGQTDLERRYVCRGLFEYRLVLVRKDLFEA